MPFIDQFTGRVEGHWFQLLAYLSGVVLTEQQVRTEDKAKMIEIRCVTASKFCGSLHQAKNESQRIRLCQSIGLSLMRIGLKRYLNLPPISAYTISKVSESRFIYKEVWLAWFLSPRPDLFLKVGVPLKLQVAQTMSMRRNKRVRRALDS